jgi:hypothetical protein
MNCTLRAKLPVPTGCSFQGAHGSKVIHRKATACALLESAVRKRTKGMGTRVLPGASASFQGCLRGKVADNASGARQRTRTSRVTTPVGQLTSGRLTDAVGDAAPILRGEDRTRLLPRAVHSSRMSIKGSTESARRAGIQVPTSPSNDIARTAPANTSGSRGVA